MRLAVSPRPAAAPLPSADGPQPPLVPSTTPEDSLLLVLPVPLCPREGQLMFEVQACNGAARWAEHFSRVTLACPLMPPQLAEHTTLQWRPTSEVEHGARMTFVPLPWAYTLRAFLRHYWPVRRLLARLIDQHVYLQFGIGGLVGDWASQGALVARRMRRPFSIWTDRVEHLVVRKLGRQAPRLRHRVKTRLTSTPMKWLEYNLVASANLGLFHGADTYEHYHRLSRNPHLCHDVHTKDHQRIPEAELHGKLQAIAAGQPLRICYAGRADPMKAPLDWLQALLYLHQVGIRFHATWMGDGPLYAAMKAFVAEHGLGQAVHLPGIETDHEKVLAVLRDSHLLLFTHVTPESPRCLVEALISGCAIAGYGSPYSRGLAPRGGVFVEPHDRRALADLLARLHENRQRLVDLVRGAYHDGAEYSDTRVFKHRSDLIKMYLPPAPPPRPTPAASEPTLPAVSDN